MKIPLYSSQEDNLRFTSHILRVLMGLLAKMKEAKRKDGVWPPDDDRKRFGA